MKKLSLLILLSQVIFFSCNKKVDELPPATQSGAHTFGARVNGEFWVTRGFGPFPANDILEAFYADIGELRIKARNFASSPTETEFELFIKGVTGPGTYQLDKDATLSNNTTSYGYFVRRKITPLNEWITNTTNTGTITITKLDLVNRFVSGTFEFRALSMYTASDILTVTEGRFDVRLL